MNNRRPVFRFTGTPGQMTQQSELAFLAQDVFFHLTGGNGNSAGAISKRELIGLGNRLKSANVIVESPAWFAKALSNPD